MDAQRDSSSREVVVTVAGLSTPPSAQGAPLNDLSFSLSAGEVYCLLGRPGAGKSTAVKSIVGLHPSMTGTVMVLGTDVRQDRLAVRRKLAYVDGAAAFHGLYESLSPVRNLEFLLSLSGTEVTRDQLYTALRRMGLPERDFDIPVASLRRSASLATLLALARLRDVGLVVLDEPTAGLDARATADFEECLGVFRQARTTAIIATSDVLLAGQVADRIAILADGRIAMERARRQILGQSVAELYVNYVGRPAPHIWSSLTPDGTPSTS